MRKALLIFFLINLFLCSYLVVQNDLEAQSKNTKNRFLWKNSISLSNSQEIVFEKENFNTDIPATKAKKRLYLKFKKSPNKIILSKLKKSGISLESYLTNNTYVVELDHVKLDFLKEMSFVDGFAEVSPVDKISKRLKENDIPSYALEGNSVKLNVDIYDETDFEKAVSSIRSIGGIIKSKKFSRTNKLRVEVHRFNIIKLAELDFVKYVEEVSPQAVPNNIDAGKLSKVFWDNDGNTISGLFDQDYSTNPVTPYGFTGEEIKVGIKDGGKIYNHTDFSGRLTIVEDDNLSLHATHVAGTVGASLSVNDNDGNTGGMARYVELYSFSIYIPFQYPPAVELDYSEDLYTALLEHNVLITNNSWGIPVGWGQYIRGYYLMWDWEDNTHLFGKYTSDAQDFDEFMYDYYDNDAIVLKSAGNDRNQEDSQSPPRHPHDGTLYDDEYYDCIPPISCAKNIITVGSLGTAESDCESSVFSSWGPTDDGRIKPDIVADGYNFISTIYETIGGQNIDSYSDNDNCGHIDESQHIPTCRKYWKGTSMACPVVTGICALIHEAYEDVYGEYPSADIVKALLCNYAHDLGNPGPDFSYGFGLVDAKASIDAIANFDAFGSTHIVTGMIGSNADYLDYQFDIIENLNDSGPIKVTLAWIDPPGNPSVTNSIVNDLHLSVYDNEGNIYNAFYFKEYDDFEGTESNVDPTVTAKNDGLYANRYDTIEQVLIPDNDGRIPAATYTIKVSGSNISVENQNFAVVSTSGLNGLTFNTLKVKGADNIWVSSKLAVLDINPDALLMITDLENDGFNPNTIEYNYANDIDNDGDPDWNASWFDVTGVYADKECTQQCSNPYYGGIAYIKVENIPFNNVSIFKNKIKFRLTYDGSTEESPAYTVKNNNIYYVDSVYGDDNTGKGTDVNPWQTIGYAITSCVSSATSPANIRVKSGTYNENISLTDYIYLYGGYDSNWYRDLENSETIINGTGSTHTLVADDNTIIDGFSIQNGNADLGGGIYSIYDNVTIKNCIIKNCSAQRGGGCYIKGTSLSIVDCIIEDNTAQLGGGVYLEDFEGTLQNCIFDTNTANSGSITTDYYHMYNYYNYAYGGGLFFVYSEAIIDHCYFKSNTTTSTYSYGGCIFTLYSSDSIISNSIFKSNSAAGAHSIQRGGAIYCHDTSDINILGSLFYENEAKQGGAIYLWNITLTNCTFYGNITNDNRTYPENVSSAIHVNSGTHNMSNCILWNNTSNYGDRNYTGTKSEFLYSCVDNDGFNGQGTIHDNPQFKDHSNGDFSLKITSPCIDAGYDSATGLNLLSEDIAKNPRVFEFDSSKTNSVDMGAYEYRWNFTQAYENDGEITLEWESLQNETYYIDYMDNDSFSSATWTRVQQGITGQTGITSWTDDGTETSPPPDNEGVINRFYKVVFDN